MKIPSFVLLAICMTAGLCACSKHPPYETLPPGTVVLAFGDSITYGTGAAAGEDYPTKLAARTGWQVVNGGLPGDTTAAARPRLAPLLAEHQPKLVIVELGGNDFLHGEADGPVAANLAAILAEIKAAGAIPVLMEVPRLSLNALLGMSGGAPLYRQVAEQQQVLLLEGVLPDILAVNALKTDPIHPNGLGYSRLAEGVDKALTAAGLRP